MLLGLVIITSALLRKSKSAERPERHFLNVLPDSTFVVCLFAFTKVLVP